MPANPTVADVRHQNGDLQHSHYENGAREQWSPAGNELDWSSSPPVLVRKGQRYPLPPGLDREVYEDICATPFLDLDSPMTAYEWAKFVLYVPFLLIRICLVAILMPPVLLTTWLVVSDLDHNQPLGSRQGAFLRPFLRFWAKLLMVLGLNFYHSVEGREHIPEAYKERALLVINHVSYLDALVMGEAFMPCGLAKSAVTDIPVVSLLAKAMQFLLVERRDTDDQHFKHSHKGRVTNLIHERAQDTRFPLFLIGPEGTTKTYDVLLPFSTGGFVHGHPVMPVLLKYRARHFNVGWGSITNPAWHFLRVQAQFINHLQVEILPVYRPSPEEVSNPRLYADNVRRLMAARLGAELCDHGLTAHARLKRARIAVDWTGRRIVQQPPKKSRSKKEA